MLSQTVTEAVQRWTESVPTHEEFITELGKVVGSQDPYRNFTALEQVFGAQGGDFTAAVALARDRRADPAVAPTLKLLRSLVMPTETTTLPTTDREKIDREVNEWLVANLKTSPEILDKIKARLQR